MSSLTSPIHSKQAFYLSLKYLPATQAVQVVKSAFTVPTQGLHFLSLASLQVLFTPQGSQENLSALTAPVQVLQAEVAMSKFLPSSHGVQVCLSALTAPGHGTHFF